MSSFGRSGFDSWGGRRSPYTAYSGHGTVTNDDFEYVDPKDEFESAGRSRTQDYLEDDLDPNQPDVIRIQHKSAVYDLNFDPFAISDEKVTIGKIRERAAEKLIGRGGDPRRIRLIYKAKQLKDDAKTAKGEGLKQLSHLMCVVSTLPHGGSSDSSASERESNISTTTNGSLSSKKKRRKSKKEPSKESLNHSSVDKGSPPNQTPRSSSPQKPAAADTPQGRVAQLASIFHTQWLTQCIQYLNHKPSSSKSIDQEYTRLTESLMGQIVIKVDDIELHGDEKARQDRKNLVNEVNMMFKKLDEAHARYAK